jgi:hypothetical protein
MAAASSMQLQMLKSILQQITETSANIAGYPTIQKLIAKFSMVSKCFQHVYDALMTAVIRQQLTSMWLPLIS